MFIVNLKQAAKKVKLLLFIWALSSCLWAGPMAANSISEPLDLVLLKNAGLSAETIGRFLAQNLDSMRVAPAIDGARLARLGQYGGDELAVSYLNLDKETAHLPRFGFSPEIIDNLLTSDVGPQILTQVLNAQTTTAAADRANLKNSPSPQPQASLGPAS
ncbi:MAG: hypothetical protein ACRCTY_09800, partial [Candidatus Adiutrix sp.]